MQSIDTSSNVVGLSHCFSWLIIFYCEKKLFLTATDGFYWLDYLLRHYYPCSFLQKSFGLNQLLANPFKCQWEQF